MRGFWLAIAACAACSSKSSGNTDATLGGEAGAVDSATDAPALPACANPIVGTTIAVRKIGNVGGGAMLATSPPADPRLFVVRQDGVIYIFDNEVKRATPFLDISAKVVAGGEQGLLGLAFHPRYAQNGKLYVDYTATNPDTADTGHPWVDVLEEYTVSADPNVADPASGKILLAIPDFATNHNGGMVEFGADGLLYVGEGDGGGGGDPERNGQNTSALLAKILRLDVDHPAGGKPYGIPAGNPFAAGGGAPEVFVYGVRNPWRFSFDRATGDLWIGDVGQNLIDELDVLPAGQQAGKNLGWSMWEGSSCFGNYTPCVRTAMVFPQVEWNHNTTPWRAIIGGQVYRGSCYPSIVGNYYFTDNVAHTMSLATLNPDHSVTYLDLPAPSGGWPQSPASLHADSRGELYETTTGGDIWHVEAGP